MSACHTHITDIDGRKDFALLGCLDGALGEQGVGSIGLAVRATAAGSDRTVQVLWQELASAFIGHERE